MPRKDIKDASVAEIRRFAAQRGLEIHANANKRTAVQRLDAVWDEDWIEVTEESRIDDIEEARREAIPEGRDPDQAYYRVRIARSETARDQVVEVGVNGHISLFPRGQECEIRAPYLEVLRRSVAKHFEQIDDEGNLEEREIPLYPLEFVSDAYWKDGEQARVA